MPAHPSPSSSHYRGDARAVCAESCVRAVAAPACAQAKVLCADYKLLRKDFAQLHGKTDAEVDEWFLDNAAFLSEGQVVRLQAGGDHNELLGIGDGIDKVIDRGDLRERSEWRR